MPIHDFPGTSDRLRAGRADLERQLLALAPPPAAGFRPYADDPALAAGLTDALIAETGPQGAGRLEPTARRHGILRAREDGTIDRLIAEYGALRLGLLGALVDPTEGDGSTPIVGPRADSTAADRWKPPWVDGPASLRGLPGVAILARSEATGGAGGRVRDAWATASELHAAIDRAVAVAASAFANERLRQSRAVMRGQDHELRGCLNAIWLAACVQRQNGGSTADLIERQTKKMRDGLDRSRQMTNRSAWRTLRLEDLLTDDLVHACRQEVAAWNASRSSHPCAVSLPASCTDRFDVERIRESIEALLAAAAWHAGPGSALQLRMVMVPEGVRITVLGESSGSATDAAARPSPKDEDPIAWLLACQTAAAHAGRLSVEHSRTGIAFEMTLGLAIAAGVDDPARAASRP